MSTAPAAEVLINDDLVATLLSEQAPDLAALPLHHYDAGWDNEIYRIGEGLLARFPRRKASASLVENESRWLPQLAVGIDVDVPQPVFVGRPSDHYPWVWSVVNMIPGVGASHISPAERAGFAEQLADAVWCLQLPAPSDAPLNPHRGVSLAQERFDTSVRTRAAQVSDTDELLARWEAWSHAPEFDGVDVWVHGDLHPHNLITDGHGHLTGIVDWGDLTAGDPATDLATAWLTFEADGRRTFRERMDDGGLVDAATWQRAKAWALHLGLILATMNDDIPLLASVGTHALEQVLTEQV